MSVLNKYQTKYKNIFIKKINAGVYKETPRKCPCGGGGDVVISRVDRYGIPLRVVLCKKCGLIRSDPYYTEKTLKQFYLHEYRQIYVGSNKKMAAYTFRSEIGTGDFINNFLRANYYQKDVSNKTIFEVGCGAGGILDKFRQLGNDTYGCDFDAEYVKYGKRKGLNLFTGGIEELIKLNKKADIIILCHVLEHFLNPVLELKKIRRLLKKNGIVFIAVPGVYFTHRSYNGDFNNAIQNAHAFYFTLRTLTNIANMSGFGLAYGDESSYSILYKKEYKNRAGVLAEDYRNILKYLKTIYRYRAWFTFVRWVSDKIFDFLKRAKLLYTIVNHYHKISGFFVNKGRK
ncbi:MAG TPA: class I SAM-dependent methyltransferase [Patescibacteria group bacterium]|nr:class I SAM-dependent methyltransferase [Patescibacteria group bacterium]